MHFVLVAAPIELRPTFAKTEDRSINQIEIDSPGLLIDAKFLNRASGFVCDAYPQRIAFKLPNQVSEPDALP